MPPTESKPEEAPPAESKPSEPPSEGSEPTQSAYLAVKACDVDEDEQGKNPEHDYVNINDDVFLPRDTFEPNGSLNCYNPATIGYLSGTNGTWNTTVLEVPLTVSYRLAGKRGVTKSTR